MSKPNYRELFGDMPPLRHDANPARSDVLGYIVKQLGCDRKRAFKHFEFLRHARRRIIVFDRASWKWRGERVVDSVAELRKLRAEFEELREAVRLIGKGVNFHHGKLDRLTRSVFNEPAGTPFD